LKEYGGDGDDFRRDLSMGQTLMLHGFNTDTKQEGFFRIQLGQKTPPKQLLMDNCSWQMVGDGKGGEYLLKKVRAEESPNYYTTKDFKEIKPISDVHPERAYNWLTAELVNFPLPDGSNCQGILYKPEDFDPHKKYPLLLNYYDQKSDGLYQYHEPRESIDNINVPYFVSRGYLVFTPDIHYKIGYTGESACAAIVSGALYLSKKPWVDGKRMGIQGHSFGGFETNYIVTHSHLFAAAVEASGPADFISDYNSIYGNSVASQFLWEIGQIRMRATPWQRPDLYLSNSPVLAADRVTTPLLMMHNKGDDAVPFGQGLEMYLSLRRLGKRAWMLQYEKGTHAVVDYREALDYTRRMEQFFDHYLKGALPPKWMTEGIPAARKGIDNGLELDSLGRKP
jgi:dipeptidyl aminopeptidase/acylaminoacyl peptidase